MKQSDNIRTLGIIAHIDAGKTTTTEHILYVTGKNKFVGSVDEGTTCTDYMSQERERGITIVSAAVSCLWNDTKLYIIDTPGHVDFTSEVERSLRVLDGAVMLICGVSGIQTQTETVWRQADKHNIARIIYINKLDRVGADYKAVVRDIESRFVASPVVMNIPYYEDDRLCGIIDIFENVLLAYDKCGKASQKLPIPDNYKEETQFILEKNLDNLTQIDDGLLESVLSGHYTKDQIVSAISYGVSTGVIAPIYCGASKINFGVTNLLDGIVTFLPSPEHADHNYADKNATLLYIFKVQKIKGLGKVAFARIYSGMLSNRTTLYNLRTGATECADQIKSIFADMFDDVEQAKSGEIVGLVGLDDVCTGDTLSTSLESRSLESIKFSQPVLTSRLEPDSATEYEKLSQAVCDLAEEDSCIEVRHNIETGCLEVSAMGELQIDIFVKRLISEYKVNVKASQPFVSYKQKPIKSQSIDYVFEYRTVDGMHQIKLSVDISPNVDDTNNIQIIDDYLGHNIRQSMTVAINNALNVGINNYGIIGANLTVKNISVADGTLSLIVQTAASQCVSKLLTDTELGMLQPMMLLTIESPTEKTGLVLGDLQSKSAQIIDISSKITSDVIIAKAPLKEFLGYTTRLRNLTQGRGSFTMELSGYSELNCGCL